MYKFLLLAAFFATTAIGCTQQNADNKFITADDSRIGYIGRVSHTRKNVARYTYPGTSIVAKFSGTSIAMKTKPESGFYMVEIDDNEAFKVNTQTADSLIVLADSLDESMHSIKIMYVVEGYELKPEFYGFVLDTGATLGAKPTLPERKIEFIGNSITCGYGVEGTADEGFAYDTENHYFTYAAIAARTLRAQHFAIARSGIGIYRNYGAPRDGSPDCMPAMYHQTLFTDTTETWDSSLYTPAVVCVNLGTNDTSLDNYDTEKLTSAYADFVARLRSIYADAQIVMLTGSMLNGKALDDVRNALNTVVDNARKNGDERISRFDFTPQDGSLGYGSDWHPSKAQQQKMADELVPYLREITGWTD